MEENTGKYEPSFGKLIEALLDFEVPFPPRYLYSLSDLYGDEFAQFQAAWPDLPDWRRQGLLEDLELMFEGDTLLSFESICRLALEDPNSQVRFIALRSLQDYEVKDLIHFFLQLLGGDPDEEIRALAASNLGKYVYLGETERLSPTSLETIENSLLKAAQTGESPLVRRRALESLGFSSRGEVPDLIEYAINTQDENWMTSALFAIGRTYDQRWAPNVLKLLDHSSSRIRIEAIRAAGELELADARPHLLDALEADEPEDRMAAAWSLSQIGGGGLQQIFESLLNKSENDEETEVIEEALDNLVFNQSIGLYDLDDFEDDLAI